MQEGDEKGRAGKRPGRQERLEAELRENLRKRKEQARARAKPQADEDEPPKPAKSATAD